MSINAVAWRNGALAVVLILGAPLLAGCIRGKHTTGVSNLWRVPGVDFTTGQTRDQDVLDALGPPSQLIALEKYTVYYYLLEKSDKTGLITIIYNANKQEVFYDRAIFFFDHQGILQRWSTSKESLPLFGEAKEEDDEEEPAESEK
jgi:hypothetical protein